jgi:hypothetical protein
LLGPDQVLTAVAARDREIAGAHQLAVRQIGEQAGVLVVGMGRDVEHAAGDPQPGERQLDLRRVRLGRRAGRVRATGHGRKRAAQRQQADQQADKERQREGRRGFLHGSTRAKESDEEEAKSEGRWTRRSERPPKDAGRCFEVHSSRAEPSEARLAAMPVG